MADPGELFQEQYLFQPPDLTVEAEITILFGAEAVRLQNLQWFQQECPERYRLPRNHNLPRPVDPMTWGITVEWDYVAQVLEEGRVEALERRRRREERRRERELAEQREKIMAFVWGYVQNVFLWDVPWEYMRGLIRGELEELEGLGSMLRYVRDWERGYRVRLRVTTSWEWAKLRQALMWKLEDFAERRGMRDAQRTLRRRLR